MKAKVKSNQSQIQNCKKTFHNQRKQPSNHFHITSLPSLQSLTETSVPSRPSLPQPLPLLREKMKEKKIFCESPNASMPMNAAKQNTSETQEKKQGIRKATRKKQKSHEQRIASIKSVSAKETTPPHSPSRRQQPHRERNPPSIGPFMHRHASYVSKKKRPPSTQLFFS